MSASSVGAASSAGDAWSATAELELGEVKEAGEGAEGGASLSEVEDAEGDALLRQLHLERGRCWHRVGVEQLARDLGCAFDASEPARSGGVSPALVARRQRVWGKNVVQSGRGPSRWAALARVGSDPLSWLLVLAAVSSLLAYLVGTGETASLLLALLLLLVVVTSGAATVAQEFRAAASLSPFAGLEATRCRVVRGGREQMLPAEELVIGDLVRLSAGDRVPADVRVVASAGLKVESAAFTGESDPTAVGVVDAAADEPLHATNLAWCGSHVREGDGYGIVVNVGPHTLVSAVATLASPSQPRAPSALEAELRRVAQLVALVGTAQAVTLFLVALARGGDPQESFGFVFVVALVANVPQGLPTTVNTCLSLAARTLAESNVFVRRFRAVETLAVCSVLAADKTGTLTQNRMSLSHVWLNAGEPIAAARTLLVEEGLPSFWRRGLSCLVAHVACVCNRAEPPHVAEEVSEGNGERARPFAPAAHEVVGNEPPSARGLLRGDAMDQALLRFFDRALGAEPVRAQYTRLLELPFSPESRFGAVAVRLVGTDCVLLLVKGAPEVVLDAATHYAIERPVESAAERAACEDGAGEAPPNAAWAAIAHGGGSYGGVVARAVNAEHRRAVETTCNELSALGERVLAVAVRELRRDEIGEASFERLMRGAASPSDVCGERLGGLTLLGLVSLFDPPRPQAARAVSEARDAGIRVFLVTGDHPRTAEAVARQVGILGRHPTWRELAREHSLSESQVLGDKRLSAAVKAAVVTGAELDAMSDAEWSRVLRMEELVFARATPHHKLAIVNQCRRRGLVVAVTGDGVNDAPALKVADVGVAMGRVGADVCRDAADLVILDDNFASIVAAVRVGRLLFENLSKSIVFTMSHLCAEVVPLLLTVTLGFPLALTSLLTLFVDLATELAPAISLAYEKAEGDLMRRPPRDPRTDRLISWRVLAYCYLQVGALECAACLISFFLVLHSYGIAPRMVVFSADKYFRADAEPLVTAAGTYDAAAQMDILRESNSAYWMTLVVSQTLHVFACTTRHASLFNQPRNMMLVYGVVIELALCLLILYVPWLAEVLGTRPVEAALWSMPFACGALIILYTETVKWRKRVAPHGWAARHLGW